MIIVNQDKTIIVNFDNVESIDIVTDLDGKGKLPHEIYYETSSKREELGTYATEERAKEVLQEIIETYSDFNYLKFFPANTTKSVEKFMHIKYKHFDTYEMPEE